MWMEVQEGSYTALEGRSVGTHTLLVKANCFVRFGQDLGREAAAFLSLLPGPREPTTCMQL